MFAYLLIGLELTILFSVFWYVFIREPKPFQIEHSGLWGSYEAGTAHFSEADLDTLVMEYKQNAKKQVLVDRRVPRFANPQMAQDLASDFRDPTLVRGSALPENGWNSLYKQTSVSSRKTVEYGWVANIDHKPQNTFAGFLQAALCWFENLSVKLP